MSKIKNLTHTPGVFRGLHKNLTPEAWTYLFLTPSFMEPTVVAFGNEWGRGGGDGGTRGGEHTLVTPALEKYIT